MEKSTKIYYALFFFISLLPFQNCGQLTSSQVASNSEEDFTSGSGAYVTYAGCEVPSKSFSRILYADPVMGLDTNAGTFAAPFKTVSAALNAHKILPGDEVIAKAGNHGTLNLSPARNPELMNSASWIHIQGEAGAVFTQISINGVGRMIISNVEITVPSGSQQNIVSLSSTTNIVLADSFLYSLKDTSAWIATNWISGAASGVGISDGNCNSILRNTVKNVRFGMVATTSNPQPPANQVNALFFENTIQYFSADGFRPNASNILFKNNRILDVLVGDTEGDDNHDDAIQGFSLGTWGAIRYDNIMIEGNWIQESTNSTTRFSAHEQGINVFDGLFSNITVRNNVVMVSSWHGIMLMGPDHAVVENNTVVGIDPKMTSWASIGASKADASGVSQPAIASVIRNNIAAANFGGSTAGVTVSNNFTITTAQGPANYVRHDLSTMTFDPHLLPTSSAYGKGAGAYP